MSLRRGGDPLDPNQPRRNSMQPQDPLRDELERQRFLEVYRGLYDDVLEILKRHDPLGVGAAVRPNEYMPEVGTLLPRIRTAASVAEVRAIVHEEFVRWRGADAGDEQRYADIAGEIDAARARRGIGTGTARP
jgi:hypothetical protein